MRVENYSTLKSASKVAFSKETVDGEDVYKLTEKCYDRNTGEAVSDVVRIVELKDNEREKSSLEAEKSSITAKITELTAIITDIGNL